MASAAVAMVMAAVVRIEDVVFEIVLEITSLIPVIPSTTATTAAGAVVMIEEEMMTVVVIAEMRIGIVVNMIWN